MTRLGGMTGLLVTLLVLSGAVWANMMWYQGGSGARGQRGVVGAIAEPGAKPVLQAGVNAKPATDPAETAQRLETTRAIQRELLQRGYDSGDTEGVVGPITRATIMAYEFDRGLPLTATPSDDVLRAIVLGAATLEPAQTAGAPRAIGLAAQDVVRTVSQSLVAAGYGPLKIDGALGDDIARAIRRFEHDQGMVETGRISGHLVAKLAKTAPRNK
jgi:peptidoglycan hydrolase-like protein with peptidoglycan-binding domain